MKIRIFLILAALAATSCAGPSAPPQTAARTGSIVEIHELAMLGKVTVPGARPGKPSDEQPSVEDSDCPCAEYVVHLDGGGLLSFGQAIPRGAHPLSVGDKVVIEGAGEDQHIVTPFGATAARALELAGL